MTPEQRFKCMSHNRAKNTGPELSLRYALWHKGFRYRINDKCLPGRPDIVLPKYRTAVFVHGCFWHGHKGCKNYTVPKTNTYFWMAKVARNQERDQEVWRLLEAKGWEVIIVWECELKKSVFEETVTRVQKEIIQNGECFHRTQEERRRSQEAWRKLRAEQRKKGLALKEELHSRR